MGKKLKVVRTYFGHIYSTCSATRVFPEIVNAGTILKIYDPEYGEEAQLATAHYVTEDGLFYALHAEEKCSFVNLKYKAWAVDHRLVRPSSYRLYERMGADNIKDDSKTKTFNEIKQSINKILMNDTYMDYPTQLDRQSYNCYSSVWLVIVAQARRSISTHVMEVTQPIQEEDTKGVLIDIRVTSILVIFLSGVVKWNMKLIKHVNVENYVRRLTLLKNIICLFTNLFALIVQINTVQGAKFT